MNPLTSNNRAIPLMGCLMGLLGIGCQPALASPTLTTMPSSAASNLPLDGEGSASSRIIKVATLEADTENTTGMTLTISSGSISKSGGSLIPFQVVTVTSGAAPPTSGTFTVPTGNNYALITNQSGLVKRDVYIYYTPGSLQDPGRYDGAIILSITDNP